LLRDLGLAQPTSLTTAASLALHADLRRALVADDLEPARVRRLLSDAAAQGIVLDTASLQHTLQTTLGRLVERLAAAPLERSTLGQLRAAAELTGVLPFQLDLWRAQNVYWDLLHTVYAGVHRRVEQGDEAARTWTEPFLLLGERLGISVSAMIRAGDCAESVVAAAEAFLAGLPPAPIQANASTRLLPETGVPALIS
jgi:hypothetical protein